MKEKKSTFSWIFSFAGQKKSGYIASVILAVIGAAFQILPFFVMAQVIGKLLAGNKDLAGYLIDCAVMAAFWLLRVLFHSLSTAQSHKATFAVLGNIRKQGLAKLAKMPLGDVQAKGSGELKNILVERVDSIEPTLAHAIPEMSSNAAVALATLIYLFVIDWRMALASLITFPLGMVFFMLMMAGYEKNYARTVAATNTLNDTAVEYIGGIEVIKAFGKAKNSYEKFVIAAKECAQSYIDWMNKSNFYFTFAMNIMPATLLSVLPIGGLLLKNGTLTPEKFVLIVILSMGLITPIIGCMKFTDDLAKVGTIISQVTDILTAPELSRPETDTESPQGSTVELRDVHFGYNDAEVLHGIDLVFPEGTVNALVGPSGSGKSTIAKLIASFWDVGSGSITVGGADIRSISALDNFISINNAVDIDLFGQVNAESAGVKHISGAGGQLDFVLGAYLSKGGKSFICLSSTFFNKKTGQLESRIRPTLENGSIVTDTRANVHYLCTEYGCVNLKGLTSWEKAEALISVAHPDFREELIREAEKLHIWRRSNKI